MLAAMSGVHRPIGRGPRAGAALAAVLVLLVCLLLAPAAAHAAGVEGGNAFNELSQKAEEQEETPKTSSTSTTKTSESETRNSNKTILIAFGVAAVLLGVVGFVIVRDARRVAPAGPDDVGEGRRGGDPARRQHNRRAKAKAARQQRKKNR
jgi:hypothetical protein